MRSLLRPLAVAPFVVVLVFILVKRPFFGLMDDATLLELVDELRRGDLAAHLGSFVANDLTEWGMFRPLYPLMVLGLYGAAGASATTLFVLNAFVVMVLIALWSWLVARIAREQGAPIDRRDAAAIAVLATFAWPWTHDLFVFPSLQEKLVLAGAALNLWWFAVDRSRVKAAAFYPVSLLVLVGGFSTKAQFAMFLPATLALFARYNPRRSARLAFVAASAAALLLTTRYFAARGEYTKRFGLESLATNLSNPKTWLLVVLAAVPVLLAGKLAKKGKWRELFAVTAPSLMIAGFLAIFLQWSVNGYLLSIVGPVVGALAAFLLVSVPRAWLGRRELTIATTILAATSLCVSAYRSSAFFTILGDFGRVVRSEQLGSASEPDAVYYLSCSEGVGAMRHYLHRFRGLSRNFDYLSNLDARLVKKGRAYLIADTKLCPLGALRGEVVFAGSRPESFQIYRLTE